VVVADDERPAENPPSAAAFATPRADDGIIIVPVP